jgi:hypothetical protein
MIASPFARRCFLSLSLALAAASAHAQTTQINTVFKPDTLGVQVAYLEKNTLGTPKRIDGDRRTYPIGGCTLVITTAKGAVTAMDLDVSKTCNPNIGPFMANGATRLPAFPQTFGSLDDAGMVYKSDCLSGCGNAVDPSLYGYIQGYHANGYVDVVFSTLQVSDVAIDAGEKWAAAMVKGSGQDYVDNTQFNCDDRYNEVATKLMKNVPITHVMVGDGFTFDPSHCKPTK